MGGFRPSRGDIAGSTVVGSDKDVDSHQFTGTVDRDWETFHQD